MIPVRKKDGNQKQDFHPFYLHSLHVEQGV